METDEIRAEATGEPTRPTDPAEFEEPTPRVEGEATRRQIVAQGQPEDSDGLRPAHPTAMRLALASGTLVLLVVTVLCAIGALLAVTLSDRPPGEVQFILSLALAIPLLLTLPLLVLPRARYRRYRWRVDEDGIEIHRGIWWRSRIMVPRNRLQHTDVAQGPLERRLGLARLIVHTAGTHNASTTLEALSLEAALGARALLADDPSVGDGT